MSTLPEATTTLDALCARAERAEAALEALQARVRLAAAELRIARCEAGNGPARRSISAALERLQEKSEVLSRNDESPRCANTGGPLSPRGSAS